MAKFKKVLVVDDSDLDRLALAKIFEKNGYQVLTASDGPEGVEMAKAQKPDCVFMDVVMPTQSGFEATRTIRTDPATKHIPVVICTTKGLKTDDMWGRRQGASDYLVKPINEKAVLAAIAKLESA